MRHYHLTTLGCQMNVSDSERVRTVIESMGYTWTEDEAKADLIGVLACSVRQKAIDRVYGRIHRWNQMKQDRSLITFATGCVLPADRDRFLKLFDMVFSMNELPELPRMIRQYGVVTPHALQPENEGALDAPAAHDGSGDAFLAFDALAEPEAQVDNREIMDAAWGIRPTPNSSVEAYVPIQNGCNKFCSFCAVPYTRGREVSRLSGEILAELQDFVARGFRSVTLLGQNVNSYGLDRRQTERSFAQLLEAIGEFGERTSRDFWVYFTSPHPRDMKPEVLDVMARYRCLARQVHLPVQSGDDEVLTRMNRRHSVARYQEIIANLRATMPDATLFTDIIVGFSGETDAEFDNTCRLVEEVGFNMAYTALYSPRPGAASSDWPDDVPREEKKRRYHAINAIVSRQSLEWNRRLVGQTVPVLVTGFDRRGECLVGLTEGKINVRLRDSSDPALVGEFVDMAVEEALPFCVDGCYAGVREDAAR